jgi:hypothetical protein
MAFVVTQPYQLYADDVGNIFFTQAGSVYYSYPPYAAVTPLPTTVPSNTGSGGGLPTGGTVGQTLVKQSSSPGDALWGVFTPSDATGAAKGILQFGGALLGSTATSQTVFSASTAAGLEATLAALRGGGVGTLMSLATSQFGMSVPVANGVLTYTNLGIQAPGTNGAASSGTGDSDGTAGYSVIRRVRFPTAAAAINNICGWYRSEPLFRIAGAGDGNGGFPILIMSSVSDVTPTQGSFFLGITQGAAGASTAEPSTLSSAHIALTKNSVEANLSLQYNNTAGTPTRVALGANFVVAQYKAFGLYLNKNAAGTIIYATPMYLDPATDIWVLGSVQTLTTNIPTSASVFIAAQCYRSSLSASLALSVDDIGMWRGAFSAAAGGGSSTLAALTDVTFGTPMDGQVLTYNIASGKSLFAAPVAVLATNWQAVTPVGSTAIPLDYSLGPNVKSGPSTNAVQNWALPTNMLDGQRMEVHHTGGGSSGTFLPVWTTGAPATAGWYFPSGAAPSTQPDATVASRFAITRKGAAYIVDQFATLGPLS